MFLSQLPPTYTLPSSCPFHPSLDLLSKLDENPGGALKGRLGGGMFRCGTCGKRFQTERFVDEHIQRRHLQEQQEQGADEPFVCLADYCDVLDCFHRGVQLDALTGEVMTEGRAGGLHGSAGGRQRRLQLANEARNRERQQARTSADMATAAASAPLVVEHPQARRCSEQSMALARARCASVLQRCFPFHGSDAADPAAPSGEDVHMLYERFHTDLCVPLHCTAEGAHANAHAVVATRAAASRARLYWILVALLLVAIAIFYFFAFQLRHEFGWKPRTTAGGGSSGSALTRPAHLKARQQNRLAAWLGMQQKRNASKIQ